MAEAPVCVHMETDWRLLYLSVRPGQRRLWVSGGILM